MRLLLVWKGHSGPLCIRCDTPVRRAHLARQQVDDLEGVLHDAHGHQLLAIVASVHHHGVGQALHNGALSFTEALGCIAAAGVGEVLGVLLLHSNVVLNGGDTDLASLQYGLNNQYDSTGLQLKSTFSLVSKSLTHVKQYFMDHRHRYSG